MLWGTLAGVHLILEAMQPCSTCMGIGFEVLWLCGMRNWRFCKPKSTKGLHWKLGIQRKKKKKSGWGNASLRNPPSTGRLPGLVRASRIFLNPSFITPWWDASLRKLVPVLPVSPDIFRAHVALSPTNTNIDGVNPLLDPHKPSSSLTMSTVYPAQKSHPPDDF